jgi:hypothetical protein
VLAVVADSDPGAVYEQHRWLGAVVGASAVCAFVAMMGWATLRHGGVPLPVLLMALAVAGVPLVVPRSWLVPAAVLAVAGCAALAGAGLAHPPAAPEPVRFAIIACAVAACALALTQALAVGLVGAAPRVQVLADAPHRVPAPPRHVASTPDHSTPVTPGGTDAAPAPETPLSAGAAPRMAAPETPPSAGPAPRMAAPAGAAVAAGRSFVRSYYAALDAHRFDLAWRALSPALQAGFGGFAAWRRGYAHTVFSTPGEVSSTPAGAGATVELTLRAGDRDACGKTVERRFAVTWRLARTEAGWVATAASARKLSGPEPC